MPPEEPKQPVRRFSHAFETLMEISVSTLPLVLVVLGIGMMSFSPRRSSVPLFRSSEEAQQFYAHNGIQFSYDKPIVLVSSSCPSCSTFTGTLKELGIPFEEQNIEVNQGAAALHAQARKISGSQGLPQIVIGDQLVNPAPHSVKIALRRLHR
ncbi:MAG: Glutaredoxin [Pseudomonadota bacterium]|jgi:glutaredoxin